MGGYHVPIAYNNREVVVNNSTVTFVVLQYT